MADETKQGMIPRRTEEERALARQKYQHDQQVWPWRGVIAFMAALLDEALVQTAAHDEMRSNLHRQLRDSLGIVQPRDAERWSSPEVYAVGPTFVRLRVCGRSQGFVEGRHLFAGVVLDPDKREVTVEWSSSERTLPRQFQDGRSASYPNLTRPIPAPGDHVREARALVEEILALLDRHDAYGVAHTKRLREVETNRRLKQSLERRRARAEKKRNAPPNRGR
jgi:hypothetical protein